MNNDEYNTTPTGLKQVKPEVALNEFNQFVQNLRNTAQTGTDEIATQTYNLGSALPASQGGLGGANGTFVSRYQTPQVNTMIEGLRSTAQAQALSDAMSNRLAELQNKYKNAYRNAYKNSNNNPDGDDGTKTNITDEIPDKEQGVGYQPTGENVLIPQENGTYSYWSGDKDYVLQGINPNSSEVLPGAGLSWPQNPKAGDTVEKNGSMWMYMPSTGWLKITSVSPHN